MSAPVRVHPWLPLLGLSLLTVVGCGNQPTTETPQALAVRVVTLQPQPVTDSSLFVGTLQAVGKVILRPQIQGRIGRIPVASGANVTAGQVLFSLEPDQSLPQFQSSVAGVFQARDQLANAQTQLRVAQSKLREAQARYDLAEVNFRRTRLLIKEGAISQLIADQAATEYKVSGEQVKVAEREVQAAATVVRQAQAQVFRSQADSAAARVNVDFKQVRSPINGEVGNISLRPGDFVTTGEVLTTITDNRLFDLSFAVPAQRATQLRPGLTVVLERPADQQPLGEGQLYFVSPEANQKQQAITVKARFRNERNLLRDSQYVQARLIWKRAPGLRVPASAVIRMGGQAFVYTMVTQEGRTVARQQPVRLGLLQQQSYPVLQGLQAGDRLVVSDLLRLRNNLEVQVRS